MKKQIELKMIDTDRNGDCFVLQSDWCDEWENNAILVEEGFRSDGISIPRAFWSLVSPQTNPASRRAGVCHDWIYRCKPCGWTRRMADRMFFAFLRADGFGFIRALACYLAVRIFGGIAWVENKMKKCDGCPMDCGKCYRYKGDEK